MFSFRIPINYFHVHMYPDSNQICLSTRIRIHSSTQDSSGNVGNRPCVEVAILNTVFQQRTELDLLTSVDKKVPGFVFYTYPDTQRIQTFHSGEQIQNFANSSAGFIGYVWTEAVSGKKSLRIKKYVDTCGRRLRRSLSISALYYLISKKKPPIKKAPVLCT